MKKNKPKKKKPFISSSQIEIQGLVPPKWTKEMRDAIEKAVSENLQRWEERQYPKFAEEAVAIPEPEIFLKKRTPVRDYARIIGIVVAVALLGSWGIGKMAGPPKGALYQISSGPFRAWTDYASKKPTLTASGCVVWFNLKGDGNIFCGEFVIADVPGRIKH